MSVKSILLSAVVTAAAVAPAVPAHAASLALNCTEYASADVPAGCSKSAIFSMLSTPGAYVYGDASLEAAGTSGGIIPGSTSTGYSGASFYDAFIFTVGNSKGDSISTTINLGNAFQISNFQERLYPYAGTAPAIGPVSGALDFWTIPTGDSGTVAVLPATFLAAGTYVLEVRGDVTGNAGGAYAGVLQLSPVPLPAASWLLVSGLCSLLGFAVPGARPHARPVILRPARVRTASADQASHRDSYRVGATR